MTKGRPYLCCRILPQNFSSDNAKLLAEYTAWKSKDDQLEDLMANVEVARKNFKMIRYSMKTKRIVGARHWQ